MRQLVLAVTLLVVAVRGQHEQGPRGLPAHTRQFLDIAPFSQGPKSRPPPVRLRGPPPPAVRGPLRPQHSGESRPIFNGPPPYAGSGPQPFPSESGQGTGHLPLNPRPNFDNPHFQPENEVNVAADEVALEISDYSSIFPDGEYVAPTREIVDSRLPTDHFSARAPQPNSFTPVATQQSPSPKENLQHQNQAKEEHQPQVSDEHLLSQVTPQQQDEPQLREPPYQPEQQTQQEQPRLQITEAAEKPQHDLPTVQEPPQQLGPQQYEQETQEVVEIVSPPRPIHHPIPGPPYPRPQDGQLHFSEFKALSLIAISQYNVINENQEPFEIQAAESREQPYRIEYDYDEEEEEEEEPDRLALLLLDSHFTCFDKNNGYYADEEVQCEVFHYCQDKLKHSWLCPQGASFHQDNICEKSSKFHFVNEFLYKEVDGEDGSNKTYADRYYPEGFEFGVARVETDGQIPQPGGGVGTGQHPPRRPTPAFLDRLPHTQPQRPQYQEEVPDAYVQDRYPGQFSRPPPDTGTPQRFSGPPIYRSDSQGHENLQEVIAHRRQG
ncbi:hypothetical protein Hamer_G023781 [Homarus americanus]|uniref:Chitin-binding type-2 domain-containing protein n=1 Tax=Homarus americanus TaxID=6706 RepID=A0A8J5MZP9_HOMAM|nr:hypothetical protein Hamer_G023781 [Homarus americanus]